jgi:hypothetical protein
MSAICNDTTTRVYYATRLTDHLSLEELEHMWTALNRSALCEPDEAYAAKMLHPLPAAPTVERIEYILAACDGKCVLDIGASGALAEGIRRVASGYWGIDHPSNNNGKPRINVFFIDLDKMPTMLPNGRGIEVIVCGEVIEHLSNPGKFLDALRTIHPAATLIVTVPNAFSAAAQRHLGRGIENVNRDHVAWYSPKTLEVLLTRAKWKINSLHSYNGTSPFAEGWIATCEGM